MGNPTPTPKPSGPVNKLVAVPANLPEYHVEVSRDPKFASSRIGYIKEGRDSNGEPVFRGNFTAESGDAFKERHHRKLECSSSGHASLGACLASMQVDYDFVRGCKITPTKVERTGRTVLIHVLTEVTAMLEHLLARIGEGSVEFGSSMKDRLAAVQAHLETLAQAKED